MPPEPSLSELLKTLRDDTVALATEEIALAKTEIAENIAKTARNVGLLAGGALIAFVALIMFFMGMARGVAALFLSMDMSATIAELLGYLIVAILVGIGAGVVISQALQTLKKHPLTPEKTIETLKEDKQWAQSKIQ